MVIKVYIFIAKQLKEEENTESVQNCSEKVQIDILGKSSILRVITWPKMAEPTIDTITTIC